MSMSGEPGPAVSYWEKSKVDEAFSKGAVLFDGSDGRNYMVHASRREKPVRRRSIRKTQTLFMCCKALRLSSLAAKLSTPKPLRLTNCEAAASAMGKPGRSPKVTSSSCLTVCRTSSWKSPIRSSTTL